MPSPFPGVDPYIEATGRWSGFHSRLITFLSKELALQLPTRYYADIEKRLVIFDTRPKTIFPDAAIFEVPESGSRDSAAAATVVADTPVLIEETLDEIEQGFVQIREQSSGDRVVAELEVLSPANKTGKSQQQYQDKQGKILRSEAHLIEIDLLLHGRYSLSAPFELIIENIKRWDFLVSVSRSSARWRHEVYPFCLPNRLPRIRVPLLQPDPDIVLDLQSVYHQAYDISPYSGIFDYRQPPPNLILSPDNAAWLQQWLSQAGYRSAQTGNGAAQLQ